MVRVLRWPALALLAAAVAACAPDRAALDTLSPRVLTGAGVPEKVGECVYDRITTLDCQHADERLLLQRDRATGDVVVLCDNHPAYAGINTSGGAAGAGAAGPAAAAGVLIGSLLSTTTSIENEKDRNQYPIYSLSLRPAKGTGLQATAWALGHPDLGTRRLAMLEEAFKQCSAVPGNTLDVGVR